MANDNDVLDTYNDTTDNIYTYAKESRDTQNRIDLFCHDNDDDRRQRRQR